MIYLVVIGMCFNCVMVGMAVEKDQSREFVCSGVSFVFLTFVFVWMLKGMAS